MMVMYKGEYFLFATNQAGFYYSKDLSNWEFVFAGFQRYPEDDDLCAPAAFVSGDTLFYTGSTYVGLPIWYSTNRKAESSSGMWRKRLFLAGTRHFCWMMTDVCICTMVQVMSSL